MIKDERGFLATLAMLCAYQHTLSLGQVHSRRARGAALGDASPEQDCKSVIMKLLFSGRSSCPSQLCTPSRGILSGTVDAASKDVSCLDNTKLGLSYGASKPGGQQGCACRCRLLPPPTHVSSSAWTTSAATAS